MKTTTKRDKLQPGDVVTFAGEALTDPEMRTWEISDEAAVTLMPNARLVVVLPNLEGFRWFLGWEDYVSFFHPAIPKFPVFVHKDDIRLITAKGGQE